MNPSLQTTYGQTRPATLAAERNRVLRNTYWLLALSMIPTVLGAWIGVATGLAAAMTPGVSLVVFLLTTALLLTASSLLIQVGR